MQDIEANLRTILRRISAAAERADRDAGEIALLAVSKRIDASRVAAALAAGVRALGESRVQEAESKIPEVEADVEWHFIGPLQSNKAALAARLFAVIHSVGRSSLVPRLSTAAVGAEKTVRAYVQLDPSPDPPSSETIAHALELCRTVVDAAGLHLEGLMTMAPYDPDPEAARPYFRHLRQVSETLADHGLPDLGLSMGMSGDFEVAIEEGATIIRVGTAIFGERPS